MQQVFNKASLYKLPTEHYFIKNAKNSFAFYPNVQFSLNIEPFQIDSKNENFFTFDDIDNRDIASSAESIFYEFTSTFPSVHAISCVSPIILAGTVTDVVYTDQHYKSPPAFTIYGFKIDKVLRGEFNEGDQIFISEHGGYIRGENSPLDEHQGVLSESECIQIKYFKNAPSPNKGDRFVLFLDTYSHISGTYAIIGAHTGKYYINHDNTVSRLLSKGDFWIYGTLEELIATVDMSAFDILRYQKINH